MRTLIHRQPFKHPDGSNADAKTGELRFGMEFRLCFTPDDVYDLKEFQRTTKTKQFPALIDTGTQLDGLIPYKTYADDCEFPNDYEKLPDDKYKVVFPNGSTESLKLCPGVLWIFSSGKGADITDPVRVPLERGMNVNAKHNPNARRPPSNYALVGLGVLRAAKAHLEVDFEKGIFSIRVPESMLA